MVIPRLLTPVSVPRTLLVMLLEKHLPLPLVSTPVKVSMVTDAALSVGMLVAGGVAPADLMVAVGIVLFVWFVVVLCFGVSMNPLTVKQFSVSSSMMTTTWLTCCVASGVTDLVGRILVLCPRFLGASLNIYVIISVVMKFVVSKLIRMCTI